MDRGCCRPARVHRHKHGEQPAISRHAEPRAGGAGEGRKTRRSRRGPARRPPRAEGDQPERVAHVGGGHVRFRVRVLAQLCELLAGAAVFARELGIHPVRDQRDLREVHFGERSHAVYGARHLSDGRGHHFGHRVLCSPRRGDHVGAGHERLVEEPSVDRLRVLHCGPRSCFAVHVRALSKGPPGGRAVQEFRQRDGDFVLDLQRAVRKLVGGVRQTHGRIPHFVGARQKGRRQLVLLRGDPVLARTHAVLAEALKRRSGTVRPFVHHPAAAGELHLLRHHLGRDLLPGVRLHDLHPLGRLLVWGLHHLQRPLLPGPRRGRRRRQQGRRRQWRRRPRRRWWWWWWGEQTANQVLGLGLQRRKQPQRAELAGGDGDDRARFEPSARQRRGKGRCRWGEGEEQCRRRRRGRGQHGRRDALHVQEHDGGAV
mmetsp:Transcript_13607/g.26927  ORF Transcript_13607/g.26927 Transcript_13607/m.26927 type:complete len:428 (-) Transcript_13607:30-1313(-)